MARHTSTRVRTLRDNHLPELGAIWRGTDEQFLEFMINAIRQMPDQPKLAMTRFYIDGETQRLNPTTGRPEAKDSRFYLHLVDGRNTLATMIRAAQNDTRPLELLEQIYGNH